MYFSLYYISLYLTDEVILINLDLEHRIIDKILRLC